MHLVNDFFFLSNKLDIMQTHYFFVRISINILLHCIRMNNEKIFALYCIHYLIDYNKINDFNILFRVFTCLLGN